MAKEKKSSNEQDVFELISIKPKAFHVNEISSDIENMNYDILSTLQVLREPKIISFDIKVDASDIENEDEKVFSIHTRSQFKIPNIENYIRDGILEVPFLLHSTMFSISYSAIRGMLIEKLASYKYSSHLLPLVNIEDTVPREFKIKLNENDI